MTRRTVLGGAALAPAATSATLPRKADFPVTGENVCLNNARWHPMSRGTRKAMEEFLDYRATGGIEGMEHGPRLQSVARQRFAELVHAEAGEIALVQSTTMGENLVVRGLGLPERGGNVVTDALHFQGSLFMYRELEKQGLEVRVVKPRGDWRIHLEDMERQIDRNTRLVAVSQISMITGFEHDLKRVSEMAQARGALVYADIIQAAGAMPIDVKAAGVDFAACSSFKWLRGDFGMGLLYAKKAHLGGRIGRALHGYRQAHTTYHLLPHEGQGESFIEFEAGRDAAGYFEVSSMATVVAAGVGHSLGYLLGVGVENIARHREPLMKKLRREMPGLGFACLTPEEARGPILAIAKKDAGAKHGARLKAAKVDVSVYPHRIRVSPSVYNDEGDVERLLEALS
ncbi:MAG: aminotransferase class V-fold PLP-dependent enzyme [Acidobacteriota bacterium]